MSFSLEDWSNEESNVMFTNSTIFTDIQDEPKSYRLEAFLIPILFAIIFIVGILGNGPLVIVYLKEKSMRNITNTYILSLALADLLIIVTCVPVASILFTFNSWPWGNVICKLFHHFITVSSGVSIFTLTALSAERYYVTVKPSNQSRRKIFTVLCCIIIWVLAFILALPITLFSNVDEFSMDNNTIFICVSFRDTTYHEIEMYNRINVIVKAIIYYILPLLIISCFYILMAQKEHKFANEIPEELNGTQIVAQDQTKRHEDRIVFAFTIVFFLCFLLEHIFKLWFYLNPRAWWEIYNNYWHALHIIGFCLSYIYSCMNPIVLYFRSDVFKQYFNKYLCCRNRRSMLLNEIHMSQLLTDE